jgi:hypothetical protein
MREHESEAHQFQPLDDVGHRLGLRRMGQKKRGAQKSRETFFPVLSDRFLQKQKEVIKKPAVQDMDEEIDEMVPESFQAAESVIGPEGQKHQETSGRKAPEAQKGPFSQGRVVNYAAEVVELPGPPKGAEPGAKRQQ